MRKQCIVRIDNGVCPIPEFAMRHPFSLQLLEGEQIAITGPNGGGKTMLVDILRGRHNLRFRSLIMISRPAANLISPTISVTLPSVTRTVV